MAIYFFVSEKNQNSEVKNCWEAQEKKRHPGERLLYLDPQIASHRFFNARITNLKPLIEEAKEGSQFVFMSLADIKMDFGQLADLLTTLASRRLTVRVLDPELRITSERTDLLIVARSTQKLLAVGSRFDELPTEVITEARRRRERGQSYDRISRELGISRNSVRKYCAKVKIDEKLKEQEERERRAEREKEEMRELKSEEKEHRFARVPPDSEMQKILIDFLRSQRHASTAKTYYAQIRRFFMFWEFCRPDSPIEHPRDITHRDVLDFMDWMQSAGKSRRYIGSSLQTLQSFLKYAREMGIIERDPSAQVKGPRKRSFEVTSEPFQKDELKEILTYCKRRAAEASTERIAFEWERNLMLFKFLAATGARISSALSVKLKDIDFERRTIKMFVKAYDSFIFRATDSFMIQLREFVLKFHERGLPETFLFTSEDPRGIDLAAVITGGPETLERLKPERARDVLKFVTKKLGLNPKLRLHSFRVSYAVFSYESGMDPVEIKERLYHRGLDQTIGYIKYAQKQQSQDWIDHG